MAMSEHSMLADLVLPRARVRKLCTLQKATLLFDRIATLPRQVRCGSQDVPWVILSATPWSPF
jgi:hypothetical protein